MHYYGYHAMSGWGYALMTVSTLTLVALLVVGLVLLVRYAGPSTPPTARPQPQSPEDILEQRPARADRPGIHGADQRVFGDSPREGRL